MDLRCSPAETPQRSGSWWGDNNRWSTHTHFYRIQQYLHVRFVVSASVGWISAFSVSCRSHMCCDSFLPGCLYVHIYQVQRFFAGCVHRHMHPTGHRQSGRGARGFSTPPFPVPCLRMGLALGVPVHSRGVEVCVCGQAWVWGSPVPLAH